MGLYKRGQVWWMSFTYKGEQQRFSTEATDKKVAEKIYLRKTITILEQKNKGKDTLPLNNKAMNTCLLWERRRLCII